MYGRGARAQGGAGGADSEKFKFIPQQSPKPINQPHPPPKMHTSKRTRSASPLHSTPTVTSLLPSSLTLLASANPNSSPSPSPPFPSFPSPPPYPGAPLGGKNRGGAKGVPWWAPCEANADEEPTVPPARVNRPSSADAPTCGADADAADDEGEEAEAEAAEVREEERKEDIQLADSFENVLCGLACAPVAALALACGGGDVDGGGGDVDVVGVDSRDWLGRATRGKDGCKGEGDAALRRRTSSPPPNPALPAPSPRIRPDSASPASPCPSPCAAAVAVACDSPAAAGGAGGGGDDAAAPRTQYIGSSSCSNSSSSTPRLFSAARLAWPVKASKKSRLERLWRAGEVAVSSSSSTANPPNPSPVADANPTDNGSWDGGTDTNAPNSESAEPAGVRWCCLAREWERACEGGGRGMLGGGGAKMEAWGGAAGADVDVKGEADLKRAGDDEREWGWGWDGDGAKSVAKRSMSASERGLGGLLGGIDEGSALRPCPCPCPCDLNGVFDTESGGAFGFGNGGDWGREGGGVWAAGRGMRGGMESMVGRDMQDTQDISQTLL
ncbi:hypothetical protein SERLADRAFT_406206 [Serpula lacrymans var. lacrymans S7.9]|uniref:Uncharacterized protein n=1 Tax=Serpula lacrymans var. lacrymans (strain S7.9) TaxID=578457 RepID=F8NKT6_SERL9|nr:uncharacterized protein SERLADRAFT_406206 [Serpula lacrymans var. lacrymans S7.9]EGO28805.1 hypothetical protein SERLADRAFT_406206 [Serpula lacrymans var. lacrymans S7.9]